VTLAQDLTCSSGFGLMVDANNITIDLGGHTLNCTGVNSNDGRCIQAGTFENGALNNPVNITIENGIIVSSGSAVYLFSAGTVTLEGVNVTGSGAACGIFLSGSQNVRITDNTISNCEAQIYQSKHVWVTGNTLINSSVLPYGSPTVVNNGNQVISGT
jgi:hypothetical protein